jgi:hypothetical protein
MVRADQLAFFQPIEKTPFQLIFRKLCNTGLQVGYLLISCETTLPLHDWARLAW